MVKYTGILQPFLLNACRTEMIHIARQKPSKHKASHFRKIALIHRKQRALTYHLRGFVRSQEADWLVTNANRQTLSLSMNTQQTEDSRHCMQAICQVRPTEQPLHELV